MNVIDAKKAARLMGNDKELYEELMVIIKGSLEEKFHHLETALGQANGDDLELYAHQFKGALRNIAADECCVLLESLEKCGTLGDFEQARGLYDLLGPAIERLVTEFDTHHWELSFN